MRVAAVALYFCLASPARAVESDVEEALARADLVSSSSPSATARNLGRKLALGVSRESFAQKTANVEGYARSFVTEHRIDGAKIVATDINGQATTTTTTDKNGRFKVEWPVGEPITLTISHRWYHSTQGGTVVVPPGGLSGKHSEYTFQTPRTATYTGLNLILRDVGKLDPNSCAVSTTVQAPNMTLDDAPQGEAGAVLHLVPAVPGLAAPYYFGLMKKWTNPLTRGLTKTSGDGGVLIFNVPPRKEPYTLVATKPGKKFTNASFVCREGGTFVNVAPPQGPTVIPA